MQSFLNSMLEVNNKLLTTINVKVDDTFGKMKTKDGDDVYFIDVYVNDFCGLLFSITYFFISNLDKYYTIDRPCGRLYSKFKDGTYDQDTFLRDHYNIPDINLKYVFNQAIDKNNVNTIIYFNTTDSNIRLTFNII